MRIIIEVKDTATLDRIDELGRYIEYMQKGMLKNTHFSDVIQSISKEW